MSELHIRLVTWNCCRGAYATKLARLASLDADVATLQECARPEQLGDSVAWFGENPRQGVGIVARSPFRVAPILLRRKSQSMFAARITGPVEFTMVVVWAKPEPTYSEALRRGIKAYRDLLAAGPVVLLGDFNSSVAWDTAHGRTDHLDLEKWLSDDFGLVSAYHASTREPPGAETRPTHYWRWKEEMPYHIDYCYLPTDWIQYLSSVSVGDYQAWAKSSDHRPLVVDVEPCEANGGGHISRRHRGTR